MRLTAKRLNFSAGEKTIVILNRLDAAELGVQPLNRVIVAKGRRHVTCIVMTSKTFLRPGEIVLYRTVYEFLSARDGDVLSVVPRHELESKGFIKEKIQGKELDYRKIRAIVDDVVERNLNDLELAALITSLEIHGLSEQEAYFFSKSMFETGRHLNFSGTVVDKHSIGGVPGDKTTMLLVPIIAAAGLTIPKTSSRSITDPAGTADRTEMLMPVDLTVNEIKRAVKKTNGCIVWAGTLDIAPADDFFIQIEHPLVLDPLLLPSILAKKKVMGAKHVVIDIPLGTTQAKVHTMKEAKKLSDRFIRLGRRLGMKIRSVVTFGDQPIGYSLGPAIEAREVLQTLRDRKQTDLVEKAISISSAILGLAGKKNARRLCCEIFRTGKAEQKLRDIIDAQGGDPDIIPEDIELGSRKMSFKATNSGFVTFINNRQLACIARTAGCPKDKKAGVEIHRKLGDAVRKGEQLFTIYSEKTQKLNDAVRMTRNPFIISKRPIPKREMLLAALGN